jgi:hypothetical protein
MRGPPTPPEDDDEDDRAAAPGGTWKRVVSTGRLPVMAWYSG